MLAQTGLTGEAGERKGKADLNEEALSMTLSMTQRLLAILAWCTMTVSGCVSMAEHRAALAELEQSCKASQKSAANLEALEQEQIHLIGELSAAQHGMKETQGDLTFTRSYLATERTVRAQAEQRVWQLTAEYEELEGESTDIRRERNLLQTEVEQLTRRLDAADQELSSIRKELISAAARARNVEREQQKTKAALAQARGKAKSLEAALAADHESWMRLQEALSTLDHRAVQSLPKEADTRTRE